MNKKKFEVARDIIFIIASIFGVIAFFRTCAHDDKFDEYNYFNASIVHQPKLKFSDVHTDLVIETLSVRPVENLFDNKGSKEDPYEFKVELSFLGKIKVKIENVGDAAIGKIRCLLTTDTNINFKRFVLDKDFRKNADIKFNQWPELTNLQLLPGEYVMLETSSIVRTFVNEKYTLHMVIIYENDFGNFYHTHTRIPLTIKPLPPMKTLREAKIFEIQEDLKKYVKSELLNNNLLQSGVPISTYALYTHDESVFVKEYLKSIQEEKSTSEKKE